jgi:hypothetical protein
MTTKEQNERSALLKRIKLTLEYGKAADERDVIHYLNTELNSDQIAALIESLNLFDDMFCHAAPKGFLETLNNRLVK